MPPVSQHSMLSHYQSETETLNICIFWQEIVCQQRYLTSVLFVDRHNWSLSCSMINATCLDVATKHSKLQKKMHSWYAYVTHTCLDVAIKTRKLQKCIHDICLCYSCMFRCCIKGRESVPSVISKEHLLTSAPIVRASPSVNFWNIHQLTGPRTSLLWI